METLKKVLIRFLAILLAVQGTLAVWLFSPNAAQAAGTQEVVINEIMWMGSETSTDDEWIELRNTTGASIDLSGWKLTNAATGGTDLTIASGTLAANGFFLISNYAATNGGSVLDVTPNIVTSSIELNNSCGTITLVNNLSQVVDTMGCTNEGAYFAGTNTGSFSSLERNVVIADGNLSTSWHTSVGRVNLDSVSLTWATPMFVNDTTPALTSSAVVNDGSSADVDFTANPNTLATNWSGFVDPESGVAFYNVGLGTAPGLTDVASFAKTTSTNHTFTGLTLVEGMTYYVTVKAINNVTLVSSGVSSDGVTLNTVNPNAPTSVTAADTANDNGGSIDVSWTASTSPDVVSYQVNYRQVGSGTWVSTNAGAGLSTAVSGLENFPVTYEFTVEAVDFNGQHSGTTAAVTAQARDNLAPIIDPAKIMLGQNKPGTPDTIAGAAGASNEPEVTVYVFDRDPNVLVATLINSVQAGADGSFSAMGIQDNVYPVVWLQLVDKAGNSSVAKTFGNDIVAPNAPTLAKATSVCDRNPCRVTLNWQDNGPDTAYYRVSYVTNGVEKRTLDLSGTSLVLDLDCGAHFDFRVFAYDQYGNESAPSNIFSFRLTPGVKTIVEFKDGHQTTRTEAIKGAREIRRASASGGLGSQIVPPAQAHDDKGTGNTGDTNNNDQNQGAQTDNQDWMRILIIVLLLLIIAGSFYALSKTVKDNNSKEIAPVTDGTAASKPARKSRRGRRRGGRTRP